MDKKQSTQFPPFMNTIMDAECWRLLEAKIKDGERPAMKGFLESIRMQVMNQEITPETYYRNAISAPVGKGTKKVRINRTVRSNGVIALYGRKYIAHHRGVKVNIKEYNSEILTYTFKDIDFTATCVWPQPESDGDDNIDVEPIGVIAVPLVTRKIRQNDELTFKGNRYLAHHRGVRVVIKDYDDDKVIYTFQGKDFTALRVV
ncbi:MAG: hypothetical protein GY765_11315 [bacterium]|nr:hypothetical protein [bacterium]